MYVCITCICMYPQCISSRQLKFVTSVRNFAFALTFLHRAIIQGDISPKQLAAMPVDDIAAGSALGQRLAAKWEVRGTIFVRRHEQGGAGDCWYLHVYGHFIYMYVYEGW